MIWYDKNYIKHIYLFIIINGTLVGILLEIFVFFWRRLKIERRVDYFLSISQEIDYEISWSYSLLIQFLKCRPCPLILILSRFYPDFIQILSRWIKFGWNQDKIEIKSGYKDMEGPFKMVRKWNNFQFFVALNVFAIEF